MLCTFQWDCHQRGVLSGRLQFYLCEATFCLFVFLSFFAPNNVLFLVFEQNYVLFIIYVMSSALLSLGTNLSCCLSSFHSLKFCVTECHRHGANKIR